MPELAQWKNLAVQLSCMMKQLCVKGQDLTVNSLDAYITNTIFKTNYAEGVPNENKVVAILSTSIF